MNTLKIIGLTIIQLVKQACLLPQNFVAAIRQRRRRIALDNEYEADRLDRLRNPANYQGK
jgi:hypothetical protein